MKASTAAVLIYDHLRSHPEKAFERYDFSEDERAPDGFGKSNDFTYKVVRTALDNILETGKVTCVEGDGGKRYQYAVSDPSEREREEIRSAIVIAISKLLFNQLNFDTEHEPELLFFKESGLQAHWIDATAGLIQISENEKVTLNVEMLDQLISLIQNRKNGNYSQISISGEGMGSEESKSMAFVKILLQDGRFHCLGIIETKSGFTGDKVRLESIREVKAGKRVNRTIDFRELEGLLKDNIDFIPGYFSKGI